MAHGRPFGNFRDGKTARLASRCAWADRCQLPQTMFGLEPLVLPRPTCTNWCSRESHACPSCRLSRWSGGPSSCQTYPQDWHRQYAPNLLATVGRTFVAPQRGQRTQSAMGPRV